MGLLVAGGTGVLGTAVVHELLDAGHAIVATWIVPKERERLASLPVKLVEADLFDAGAAEAAVAAVEDLEAVVDLVGGFSSGPRVHETDLEDFERVVRLNLTPAFTLARAAMPRMMERGGGAFVGVSARPALRRRPGGGTTRRSGADGEARTGSAAPAEVTASPRTAVRGLCVYFTSVTTPNEPHHRCLRPCSPSRRSTRRTRRSTSIAS